jgi:hypothetical protein
MGRNLDSGGIRLSQGDSVSFYLIFDRVPKWRQALDQHNLPLHKTHFHITTANLAGSTNAQYGTFLAWG